MSDVARAEYARRFNTRTRLRNTGMYWPTEEAQPVESRKLATVVDAWWEAAAAGLPLLFRRDDAA